MMQEMKENKLCHYEVVLQNDAEKDPNIAMGTLVVIGYENGKFFMHIVNWGAEEDYERSRRGIVEQDWLYNEENTRKLMEHLRVRTGKGLVNKMYRRFKGRTSPDWAITRYCKERGIEGQYFVHY